MNMADIELIIKIPEEIYQTIIEHTEEILDESSFIEPKYLYRAVLKSTPLPKGHGRLIDADERRKEIDEEDRWVVDLADAIIEADKESEG
jgi:hypothetical protein